MRKSLTALIALTLFTFSSCYRGRKEDTKQPASASVATTAPSENSIANPDFSIVTPHGWTKEYHPFPLDFAPQITYKGYADVRFPPSWSFRAGDEFWSYVGIWWLTDTPRLDDKTLVQTLEQYYTGLARKYRPGSIKPTDSMALATAHVIKTTTDTSDAATYNATATVYDGFVTMSRLNINFKIHVIPCEKGKATVVIFEISPKDYTNSIWQTMDKIKSQFKCTD
jgi:hypothetical protein